MNNDEIAKKIMDTLQGQRFADWYNKGNFDAFISGDITSPPEETILEEIKKLFNLS